MSTSIKPATESDVLALHEFGLSIPELRVSAKAPFMTVDELRDRVNSTSGLSVFLVARNCVPKRAPDRIVGFVHGQVEDARNGIACLVYLAVAKDRREAGLGRELLDRAIGGLTLRGAKTVYLLADKKVVPYFEKLGFDKGRTVVWMDATLSSEERPKSKLLADEIRELWGPQYDQPRTPNERRAVAREIDAIFQRYAGVTLAETGIERHAGESDGNGEPMGDIPVVYVTFPGGACAARCTRGEVASFRTKEDREAWRRWRGISSQRTSK